MKRLILFFLLIMPFFSNAQNKFIHYVLEPKIVDFQFKEDSLLLTIESYSLDWQYGDAIIKKHVRKELYKIDTIAIFKGQVIPEKTIEEHYKFDNDFEFHKKSLFYDENLFDYQGIDSLYHIPKN